MAKYTFNATTKPYVTLQCNAALSMSQTVLFHFPEDRYGRTALHKHAINGSLENMNWNISSEKFCLDQTDCYGRTALHYVSERGNIKSTQILLIHGANPNIVDMRGYSPMHYAAEAGCTDVIEELILHKGEIHIPTKGGITPLHLAALYGHEETEKLLLDNGANVNQTDDSGGTALHFASLMGYLEIVKILIARDAKINENTSNGKTPLNYANDFEEVKKILLEHGATSGTGIPDATDPIHNSNISTLYNNTLEEEAPKLGDIDDYFISP